jgi:hypothetical protein
MLSDMLQRSKRENSTSAGGVVVDAEGLEPL